MYHLSLFRLFWYVAHRSKSLLREVSHWALSEIFSYISPSEVYFDLAWYLPYQMISLYIYLFFVCIISIEFSFSIYINHRAKYLLREVWSWVLIEVLPNEASSIRVTEPRSRMVFIVSNDIFLCMVSSIIYSSCIKSFEYSFLIYLHIERRIFWDVSNRLRSSHLTKRGLFW